jgi:hypothetical protein
MKTQLEILFPFLHLGQMLIVQALQFSRFCLLIIEGANLRGQVIYL